jgi:hypothetical protein
MAVLPGGTGSSGILLLDLREIELDAFDDLHSAFDRAWPALEQTGHFRWRLHVPFRIGLQPETGFLDRTVLADTGDNVLKGTPFGAVIEDVIGRHHGRAGQPRQLV